MMSNNIVIPSRQVGLINIFTILLFCVISFIPQSFHDVYPVYIRISLCIFLLLFILDKKYRHDLFGLKDWPIWLFLISMSAGIIHAQNKDLAIKIYLSITAFFFLLFYLGKGIFSSSQNRSKICIVISLCACIVALIGLAELYFGKNVLYGYLVDNFFYLRYINQSYPRPMSTQTHPAVLGSYLLACLPFNFYLFKSNLPFLKGLGIICALLCTTVIILTFSLGAFLGLVALASFYLWQRKRIKTMLVFISCAVLFILFCSLSNNSNFSQFTFKRVMHVSLPFGYRAERAKMTARILKAHPFSGIGFKHSRVRFNEYCIERNCQADLDEFKILDNMYLTFLSETGIIGTMGFLFLMVFLFKRGLNRIRNSKNSNQREILQIVLAALVGLLVNMAAYDLFYWSNPLMLFALFCGFIQRGSQDLPV